MTAPPAPSRHRAGLLVVILLGVIFLVILTMLVLSAGKKKPEEVREAEKLTVMAPRIRLRTEPHAKAPVVTTATAGEELLLIEDRGAWVRVQNSDGLAGWAERNTLERTFERVRRLARYAAIRKLPPLRGVASERTQLYAGPGIFYPLVGELPEGTEIEVFTRDHDFYAIEHVGEVAYADVDAIDVAAQTGSPQLEVGSTITQTAPTETSASAAPVPDAPPPPVVPAPEPSAATGVYAAVPAGGTQPEELERVIPRYPSRAQSMRTSGAVVIRGIVRKDGTIDNVEIIKDLPNGLGEAAREAVERWRFRPATYRGEPIDVYYTVTVNFKLQ